MSEHGVTPRPTVILGILYAPSLDRPILQYTIVMIIVHSNKVQQILMRIIRMMRMMMIGNYPKYQQTMHHVLQCILADSGLNIETIGTRGHSHDNLAMMKIPSE